MSAVKEILFAEQDTTNIAHEFDLQVESVSVVEPEFAPEIESVSEVKEISFEEEAAREVDDESPDEVTTLRPLNNKDIVEVGTVNWESLRTFWPSFLKQG